MRNVKYIVKFVVNPMLDDEFDFKDEALAWAEEHLSEKPVVTAIDIEYPDEFGAEPIIYDSEEIFHYAAEEHPDEDKVDNAEKLSDLDNRLADLEAELDMPELTPEEEAEWEAQMEKEEEDRKWGEACMYDADEFDGHENLTESANVVSEIKKNSKFKDLRDATISKFIELYIDDTGAEKSEVKAEDVIEWVDDPLQVLFDFSDEFNGLAAVDIVMKDPKAIKVCKKLCDENNVFDPIDDQDKEEPTDEEVVNYFIKEGTSVNDAIDLLSKEYKKLDEDIILFDPFGCDFSECEPMEVCADEHRADCCKDFSINAVDFFKELAAELGLEDEVEIKPVEGECENCEPEVSEVSDEVKVEEPVGEVPPTEVPVEIPAEDPVVTDEQGVEAPAEEITKCEVCPECGKEICDGEECKDCKEEEKPLEEAKEEDIVTPGVKCEQTLEYAEDGENVNKEDKVITYDEDQKKDLEKLDEASHPQEAQPIVDNVKAFNIALEIAKRANKPVIYGYFGPNHHGENRYYEIPHVVCDDLAKCTKDVMTQYHPNGSVLVAYPDKEFVEEGLDEDLALNEIFGWSEHKKLDKLFAAKQYKVKGIKEDETREEHNFKTYKDAAKWCSVFTKNPNNKAAYIYVDETEFRKYITDPTIKALEVYTNGQVNKSRIEDILKKSKELADKNKAAEKSDKKLGRLNKKAVDEVSEVSELEDEPKVEETPKAEEPKVEETPAETPKKGSKGSIANSRNIKIKKSLAAAGIDVSGLDKEKINALRKELFGEALEEDEEVPNSELENKELFVEEAEEEMSDLELAEKLDAALKELNQK